MKSSIDSPGNVSIRLPEKQMLDQNLQPYGYEDQSPGDFDFVFQQMPVSLADFGSDQTYDESYDSYNE